MNAWGAPAFVTKRFDGPDPIWYHLIRNDLRLKLESFQKACTQFQRTGLKRYDLS
jgi:hypothetical protein